MAEERFKHLEGAGLPQEVQKALKALKRFENLEIGSTKPAAAPPPRAPAAGEGKLLCLHCGQPNEGERQVCWACFQPLRAKAKPPAPAAAAAEAQEITLVLDGNTYRSGDADIPDDIRVLMARIRKEGYSQKLLAEWRSWRVTRRSQPLPQTPFVPGPPDASVETIGSDASLDIKVFRGSRVSVIRLDGKVYTSDDPDLQPEMRQLFTYLEANGVTPALMEYLRQFGARVKFRPADTLQPSDGDLAFWKDVQATGPATFSEGAAQLELERARLRFAQARNRIFGVVVAVAILVLYWLSISMTHLR